MVVNKERSSRCCPFVLRERNRFVRRVTPCVPPKESRSTGLLLFLSARRAAVNRCPCRERFFHLSHLCVAHSCNPDTPSIIIITIITITPPHETRALACALVLLTKQYRKYRNRRSKHYTVPRTFARESRPSLVCTAAVSRCALSFLIVRRSNNNNG